MGFFPASRSRSPPVPLYRSLLLSSETDPDLGGGQLVYGHHRRGDPRNCTRVDWSLFLGYGRYAFSGVTAAAVAILRSHNIRYIGVTKAPFWRMFFCGGGGHWRSGTGYRALFVLACGPGGPIADAERQVLREARGLFLPLENAASSRGGEHVSRSERRPLFLYGCTRCYDDRLRPCQYCSAFRRRIFSDDTVDGGDGDHDDDDDTTTLSHHGDHDNDDDTTTTTGADSGVAGAGPSSGLAEAVTPPLGSGSVAGGGVAATPAGPPLEPPLPPLLSDERLVELDPAELVFVVLPSLAGAAYPRASLRIIASSACEVKIRSNSAENYKVNPNPVVVAPGDQVAIDIAMTRDFRHLKTLWSQHRWQIEARALHDGRVEKHVIKATV